MMTGFALGLAGAGGLLGPTGFAVALRGGGPGSVPSEGPWRASAAALTACRPHRQSKAGIEVAVQML